MFLLSGMYEKGVVYVRTDEAMAFGKTDGISKQQCSTVRIAVRAV